MSVVMSWLVLAGALAAWTLIGLVIAVGVGRVMDAYDDEPALPRRNGSRW